jgi:FKBP-type peptidyl-prolyl cis-trans isomerase
MNMQRFGIILVAALLLGAVPALAAPAVSPALSPAANKAYLAAFARKPGVVVRPSGLMYRILHSGFGRRPAPTDYVTVYYTGTLIDGTEFDGTEPDMPARFRVNTLIPGWSEALTQMRVGDHWQVVIPANMGYGNRGAGQLIPPGQTLVFDLELMKVVPPKPIPRDPDANPDKYDDNQDLGPADDAG